MKKTFKCPCGTLLHIDHVCYDEHGGGCPHCGEHFDFDTLRRLFTPAPRLHRCEDAPCCGCC